MSTNFLNSPSLLCAKKTVRAKANHPNFNFKQYSNYTVYFITFHVLIFFTKYVVKP